MSKVCCGDTPEELKKLRKMFELSQKQHILKNIQFFIINDEMRNIDSDFNEYDIEDVSLFRDIDYRLIPEYFDRQTQNAMVWGNAIGISDKMLNSPELESLVIREIIWFIRFYDVKLIAPDVPYDLNQKLKRKNIPINIDYKTLATEKGKLKNDN